MAAISVSVWAVFSSEFSMRRKHLDLGCGDMPRNPFQASELFGIDVVDLLQGRRASHDFVLAVADLTKELIPYEDNYFDSVSAYDFIEHVPRYSVSAVGISYSPFIQLMSEVYRVLKPGGLFLASTPAFPSQAAFVDPTHVNFIALGTADYFSGEDPYAARYGFKGSFLIRENHFDSQKNAHDPSRGVLQKKLKNFRKRIKGQLTHITWLLEANKSHESNAKL
jgi:SAM-dependent methyltransferase